MSEDERRDELYAKFQETDEMQDWDEFVTQTRKALEANPHAEAVTVPAAFLRRVMSDLSGTPQMFTSYRNRFNQLCDELRMPEEKHHMPRQPEGGKEEGF